MSIDGADRAAIEELHRRDVEASRRGDFETLRELMDDEAVVLPPGGRVQRGAGTLRAAFASMAEQYARIEVLDYHQRFADVTICGDYAFEWGWIWGSMRVRGEEAVRPSRHHVLRVLRRQADGSFKVLRTMWNEAPSDEAIE